MPPNFCQRPLTLADCVAASALQSEVMPNPWSSAQFADSLRAANFCQVLVANSELVGVAVLSVVLDEAELLTLAVARHWQGQGVGSVFLSSLLHAQELTACQRCTLEVMVGNHPAIGLYATQGFSQVGLRKDYYRVAGLPRDAIVMQKQLRKE